MTATRAPRQRRRKGSPLDWIQPTARCAGDEDPAWVTHPQYLDRATKTRLGAICSHVTAWTVHQPWGHGPVYLAHPLLSGTKVQARCRQCWWCGPDRTGDTHADALVWDDSQQHAHHVGARCGIPDCAEPAYLEPVL